VGMVDCILQQALGMATASAEKATETIAQCGLWLASDRSTFVNAVDIVIDGGLLGGRKFTPHHEGLEQVKAARGI